MKYEAMPIDKEWFSVKKKLYSIFKFFYMALLHHPRFDWPWNLSANVAIDLAHNNLLKNSDVEN